MRAESDFDEVDVVLWGSPETEDLSPSGAAAAFAIVAFMAFVMGLALAALLFL